MGIVKNVFLGLVLSAVFLAGYQLGRRPDSPDVIGWLQARFSELIAAADL